MEAEKIINTNINLKISGRIFPIEESGYEKLKNYIDESNIFTNDKIKSKNKTTKLSKLEGIEIINDIEGRIAELLNEKIQRGAAIINSDNIEEVILSIRQQDFKTKENKAHYFVSGFDVVKMEQLRVKQKRISYDYPYLFADTNFVQQSQGKFPNSEFYRNSIGSFTLKTPNGKIYFDEDWTDGYDILPDSFVGRKYKVSGDKVLIDKLIKKMNSEGVLEETEATAGETDLLKKITNEFGQAPKNADIRVLRRGKVEVYYYSPNSDAKNWADKIRAKYGWGSADLYRSEIGYINTYNTLFNEWQQIKIVDDEDGKWYLTKIDTTHFYLNNNFDDAVKKIGFAYHIREFRSRPFYEEVRSWLKSAFTYTEGGEIDGGGKGVSEGKDLYIVEIRVHDDDGDYTEEDFEFDNRKDAFDFARKNGNVHEIYYYPKGTSSNPKSIYAKGGEVKKGSEWAFWAGLLGLGVLGYFGINKK